MPSTTVGASLWDALRHDAKTNPPPQHRTVLVQFQCSQPMRGSLGAGGWVVVEGGRYLSEEALGLGPAVFWWPLPEAVDARAARPADDKHSDAMLQAEAVRLLTAMQSCTRSPDAGFCGACPLREVERLEDCLGFFEGLIAENAVLRDKLATAEQGGPPIDKAEADRLKTLEHHGIVWV